MKIAIYERLQFEHVYPNEEFKEPLHYLKEIPFNQLLTFIGFSNTVPQPKYYEFFSNPQIKQEVLNRVRTYCIETGTDKQPELIEPASSLRLAEIILSSQTYFKENESKLTTDELELNIFKAYLAVNSQMNKHADDVQKTFPEEASRLDIVFDVLVSAAFHSSDIGWSVPHHGGFFKLLYATLLKVRFLFDFLDERGLASLGDHIIATHNQESRESFLRETQRLFSVLVKLKLNNTFKFSSDDVRQSALLDSFVVRSLEVSDDFTTLKINPVIELEKNVYTIINFYYVLDKFYRSLMFSMKSFYENKIDEDFFSFFSLEFSERTMGKRVLDKIFHQKWLIKSSGQDYDNAPDYYVRERNKVFLFEIKDVRIPAGVKASFNPDTIKAELTKKLVRNQRGKAKGVLQLANNIINLIEGKITEDAGFQFRRSMKIFPVLIICDRTLEVPGINYFLNLQFREGIQEKVKDKFILKSIQDLIVIDIDTLLYNSDSYSENIHIFYSDIVDYGKKQRAPIKGIAYKQEEIISMKLQPFSHSYNHKPNIRSSGKELFAELLTKEV
tara:strand:- start:11593 stop:13263 length:1671 start_codon:yes stop_codon:yes gene_type:complete